MIVIIGRPSVISSETTLETLRDRTWYCWCQTENQVTSTRMRFVLLSLRLLEVSNSRGGLSFVELRRRTWDASLRLRVPGRFEDRVTGRIVYSLRLAKATNCSLRARLLRLRSRPLCIRAHERGKVCCPFSQEEYAYIVCRERGESRKHKRVITKSHFL